AVRRREAVGTLRLRTGTREKEDEEMPRAKRKPTIAADLQVITRQLAALTERVREAEAVKNAVDEVMKSTNSRAATTSTGKRRGRPPGSKNKTKPANGRRRRRRTTAST